jgi:hypothetical protein
MNEISYLFEIITSIKDTYNVVLILFYPQFSTESTVIEKMGAW